MAELTNEQLQKLINLGNLQSFKTKLESKIDTTYAKASELDSLEVTVQDNSQDIQSLETNVAGIQESLGNYATKTELSYKADAQHNHEISEIGGLEDALAGKASVESLANYALKSDIKEVDLSGYQTKESDELDTSSNTIVGAINELNDVANSIIDGTQVVGDANKLGGVAASEYAKSSDVASTYATKKALDKKADLVHIHEIDNISGLTEALGAKANASELDNYVLKSNVATDEDIDLLFA